jgi:hypothetical protein
MNSVNKLTFVMVKGCVLFEVSEVKLSRYRHAGDKGERRIAPTHS